MIASISDSIAQWATAVGAAFVAFQLRQTQRSLRATFEQTFVQRYERIIATVPLSALLEGRSPAPGGDATDRIERAFFDYFELCEEELYYRKLGRIRRRTWEDWWEGMALHLRNDAFVSALDRLTERSLTADADPERRRQTRFFLTVEARRAACAHQGFDPVEGWWRARAYGRYQ